MAFSLQKAIWRRRKKWGKNGLNFSHSVGWNLFVCSTLEKCMYDTLTANLYHNFGCVANNFFLSFPLDFPSNGLVQLINQPYHNCRQIFIIKFQLKSGQIKRNLDQIQIVQRDLQTCVQEFQRARKAYHEVMLMTCLILNWWHVSYINI